MDRSKGHLPTTNIMVKVYKFLEVAGGRPGRLLDILARNLSGRK